MRGVQLCCHPLGRLNPTEAVGIRKRMVLAGGTAAGSWRHVGAAVGNCNTPGPGFADQQHQGGTSSS